MTTLEDAFSELCGICRPRPDQDESGLEATARGLWKVLGEYPEPVALAALDLWPRRSEWFPTGKELRTLLDEVQTEARISAAERKHVGGGRYNVPVGSTVAFVDEVRRRRGEAYVKSWLRGGVTAQFANAKVYAPPFCAEWMTREVGDIARHLGVQIVACDEVGALLRQYCDEHNLSYEPKRRRR